MLDKYSVHRANEQMREGDPAAGTRAPGFLGPRI